MPFTSRPDAPTLFTAQIALLREEGAEIKASLASSRGSAEDVSRLRRFVGRLETATALLAAFGEAADQVTSAMEAAMASANLSGAAAEPFLQVEIQLRELVRVLTVMQADAEVAKTGFGKALASVKPLTGDNP